MASFLNPARSIVAALCFITMMIASGGQASAAATEAEARAFFTKFVTAQNAHDASAVRAMLWNSPHMLWFSRNIETRGSEAVADRFKEYYEGTWHLEPDMSQFHVATISDDAMRILVPVVITRGLPAKRSFVMQMAAYRFEIGLVNSLSNGRSRPSRASIDFILHLSAD